MSQNVPEYVNLRQKFRSLLVMGKSSILTARFGLLSPKPKILATSLTEMTGTGHNLVGYARPQVIDVDLL